MLSSFFTATKVTASLFLLVQLVAGQAGEVSNCEGNFGVVESDVNKCRTQTGPQCTLALVCSEGPLDPDIEGNVYIYNNACQCVNSFEEYNYASSGDSSEFPFTIPTSGNGLNYDTIITYTDCQENPEVSWTYNGATWTESDCDCEEDDDGTLSGITSCRCPFSC